MRSRHEPPLFGRFDLKRIFAMFLKSNVVRATLAVYEKSKRV